MRIGLIRRSHDLNQQRRRASSALNADCATPQPARPRLGSGLVVRRASSVVSDGPPGGGGGHDDGSSGHQLKSRSMTIGGYRARQLDGEALFFARSNSQDAGGGGGGGPDGRGPTPCQLVRQPTLAAPGWGESTDEAQTEELCNGKVLSVLAFIFAVLLLTLGFAIAVRYLYR